mgnify:CR=1 FL=1
MPAAAEPWVEESAVGDLGRRVLIAGVFRALLITVALGSGLFLTPRDYLQGESVRIMYVHVPAAWLGMAGWMGIAGASFT